MSWTAQLQLALSQALSFVSLVSIDVSFGPAHPAAHGVFRLLLQLSGEIVTGVQFSGGLLYRATELIVEGRQLELITGYFARMDYVSHLVFELGLAGSMLDVGWMNEVLLDWNWVANHMLNLGCLLADAGLVSAILWAFECREIIAENIESMLGVRMHVHVASARWSSVTLSEINRQALAKTLMTTCEVMLLVVTGSRINSQRLFSNYSIEWMDVQSELLTGPLAACTGWVLEIVGEYSVGVDSGQLQLLGGLHSCTLVRHLLRCRMCSRLVSKISSDVIIHLLHLFRA